MLECLSARVPLSSVIILLDPCSLGVHLTEIALSLCVASCCSPLEPAKCLFWILFNAVTVQINHRERVLCPGLAMFGSFCQPLRGFRIVLTYASVPQIIKAPKLKLGLNKVLFG